MWIKPCYSLPSKFSLCMQIPHGAMIPLGNLALGECPGPSLTPFPHPSTPWSCCPGTFMTEKPLTLPFWFFLQRIFNSFVYTEKISNGESEVQQVSPKPLHLHWQGQLREFFLSAFVALPNLRSQPGTGWRWGWVHVLMMLLRILQSFSIAWCVPWKQKGPHEEAPINCQPFMLEVSLFEFQIQSKPINVIMMWKYGTATACYITGVLGGYL